MEYFPPFTMRNTCFFWDVLGTIALRVDLLVSCGVSTEWIDLFIINTDGHTCSFCGKIPPWPWVAPPFPILSTNSYPVGGCWLQICKDLFTSKGVSTFSIVTLLLGPMGKRLVKRRNSSIWGKLLLVHSRRNEFSGLPEAFDLKSFIRQEKNISLIN